MGRLLNGVSGPKMFEGQTVLVSVEQEIGEKDGGPNKNILIIDLSSYSSLKVKLELGLTNIFCSPIIKSINIDYRLCSSFICLSLFIIQTH